MIALVATGACQSGSGDPSVYAVAELYPRCDRMVGKTVRVRGYLSDCAGYDCHLSPDKRTWEKWLKDVLRPTPGRTSTAIAMTIGYSAAFDAKARPLQNSYVVITGRITGSCLPGGFDRASGIEPTDIHQWTPAEGAPANN